MDAIYRGEIYLADLSPVIGSEQGGVRPVVIIQNDVGNKFSQTVIVTAITSQQLKTKLPTHIDIEGYKFGLSKDSIILCEQIRTIDKRRLKLKLGKISAEVLQKLNIALKVSIGTD